VSRWKNFSYLEELFGRETLYRSEASQSNHFMYWNYGKVAQQGEEEEEAGEGEERSKKGWINPTERIYLTYRQWLRYALENYHADTSPTSLPGGRRGKGPEEGFKYFRVSGFDNNSSPLFGEFPFFNSHKSFFLVRPEDQEGIHCRFCEFLPLASLPPLDSCSLSQR
jgi:hypothetical protein